MANHLEGNLVLNSQDNVRVGIVVARFNDFITGRLLDAAIDTFARHGGDANNLTIAHVPGSVELPLVAKRMADSGSFDAIICLGCVIRGETSHYDMVVQQAAKGISEVGLASGIPCIFGVLTCDTLEQAINRAGAKAGNNGGKSMLAAIEMINLLKKM